MTLINLAIPKLYRDQYQHAGVQLTKNERLSYRATRRGIVKAVVTPLLHHFCPITGGAPLCFRSLGYMGLILE